MGRRNRSSPVTVLRPDPETGELVAVATAPASARKPVAVPRAAFGLWDGRIQAWAVGPVSLGALAATMARQEVEKGSPALYGGDYYPRQLNKAEWATLRRLLAEGSE